MRGVEGVEQVVVGQVAEEGERGEVEPWWFVVLALRALFHSISFGFAQGKHTIVTRRKGQNERDDLPANDSGNLPLIGEISAESRELETRDVGERAVRASADGQARDDDQRQTDP